MLTFLPWCEGGGRFVRHIHGVPPCPILGVHADGAVTIYEAHEYLTPDEARQVVQVLACALGLEVRVMAECERR